MAAQVIDTRRPHRQDTFDLRNEIVPDDTAHRPHIDGSIHTSDEEHSVLDDDSSQDEGGDGEYMDEDDGSSSLSIPNESIDFDLVYSLHTFAATVEGQASVVKGDSLFLMDDSNSYWWLVRVLTTQDVGYIPAENIETPFERLARLNKHRNVDLASATQEELQEDVQTSRDRIRGVISPRNGQGASPNGAAERKSVVFTGSSVYNYPPALWGDEDIDEDDDWDMDEGEGEYEGEYEEEDSHVTVTHAGPEGMEPDDGMSWENTAVEEERARARTAAAATSIPVSPISATAVTTIVVNPPNALQPSGGQPPLSPITTSPQQPMGLASTIRQQTSRERLQLNDSPVQASPASPSSPATTASPSSATSTVRVLVDPAAAGETRNLSLTPSIAREAARQSLLQQESIAKRAREEAEEAVRKKKKDSVQSISSPSIKTTSTLVDTGKSAPPSKLRKGRDSPAQEEDGGKEKKKNRGVFGGLFGRRKDKGKDKMSEGIEGGRTSEDSTRSGSIHGHYTSSPPETGPPITSSPPATAMRARSSSDSRRSNAGSTPIPGQMPSTQGTPPPSVSQHSLKMQQIDQQQQALYQQYLKSSPASPPEGPSYGLQSASSVMPSTSTSTNSGLTPGWRNQGGRPGSLILSPTGLDGQGVPELSVIRVFAGPSLHTEATFKTVLLNTSTTSSDLIRQAMQRFRLAAGEDAADYYLEIKQVEGSSAVLLPQERPLGVFENLVEAAQLEVPRVKRSSMGSISSVSSTLSMHPAIKKLSMNDFTDDSAVKFYLNRRTSSESDVSADGEDSTLRLSASEDADIVSPASPLTPSLTVTAASGSNVTPERFSSPLSRFALQVFILPDDLPDGMVFDPHTEAIVPKSTLRDRSLVNAAASPGVSQTQRRKVLQFPKNTTVAEVIELALERFGIAEGVVDGGDEVEDKVTKRMSLAHVRYGLAVQIDGQERNLQPSSKILDAFSRPPIFKAVERRPAEKRRSADSAMLLGTGDDVRPDDPVFVLRRAKGFRTTGKRMSAPLDEIALQHLHQRESAVPSSPGAHGVVDEGKSMHQQQQMSRQELIAAQRAASRANQRALLSAQHNSERGVDVLLPGGNAMLRSSLHETSDKMRYSYVQDGETYDISDIVEEEQRGGRMVTGANKKDWLEGVVSRNQEGLGDNLDRLLTKIKGNKPTSGAQLSPGMTEDSQRSSTSSYSVGEQEAEPPVKSVVEPPAPSSRVATPSAAGATRAASTTPTDREKAGSGAGRYPRKQASAGSVILSEESSTESSPSTPATTTNHHARSNTNTPRRAPLIVKDDFGVSDMMAIIELGASSKKLPAPPEMDHVDEMLFGSKIHMEDLHPRVREMFESTFKQLDDMDRQLDLALAATSHSF